MSNDEQALMSAILADPADDHPRHMLANWLEEQGDADRAAFIRDCIWMHANHTDCPVRLSDLGRGRPVPLRCGICEYCTRRRRAEKFYAKHPWIEAPSYAVAFEPTPLDGVMPTCPGLMLVIQRGFVAEVYCTLQGWMGGCRQCDKCGNVNDGFGAGNMCCLRCSDGLMKAIPGHGPAIVSRHPVERVVTEKRPSNIGRYGWQRDDDVSEASRLPFDVWDLLPGYKRGSQHGSRWKWYETEQAARDALECHAAIAWAKQQNQRKG